jgi:predicted transcriptional regulator
MAIPRLPDAELEIMKIVWNCEGEVTSAYVSQKLEGKKDWAVTTVLNFLARLVDRGFLTVKRNNKTNSYTPIINEETYLKSESQSFLKRLHGNSIRSLLASLYDGNPVTHDDLDELKRFIDEKTGGQ